MKIWSRCRTSHRPRRQFRHQCGNHCLQHRQPRSQSCGQKDGEEYGQGHSGRSYQETTGETGGKKTRREKEEVGDRRFSSTPRKVIILNISLLTFVSNDLYSI